jgi:glycosyltransferase involved in cell wall biosynthesis
VRVAFIVGAFDNNQLGRAHSLWLLSCAAGHEARLYSVKGGELWAPLRGDPAFGAACYTVTRPELVTSLRAWPDVVVAVKAIPDSLGVALGVAEEVERPLMVDIDDPDLEIHIVYGRRLRLLARKVRHPQRYKLLSELHHAAMSLPTITSNPILHKLYGGQVIPHARPDLGAGNDHVSHTPTVGFIGTPLRHKGIDLLRAAVARLADRGYTLVITAEPPPGPTVPWERWVGVISSIEGMTLLRTCDIVALPSILVDYAPAQLPMKLIDAMLAARAIAVSDVGPMPWAVGDAGVVFEPGSVDSVVAALEALRDPTVRSGLGADARATAVRRFTPEALAPVFNEALNAAYDGFTREQLP